MKWILYQKSFNKALSLSIVLILSLVLIIPVFSGCGGGTASSNTFMELLNLVPSSYAIGYSVSFTLVDHASFYKDFEISFTTPDELVSLMTTKFEDLMYLFYGEVITGYGNNIDISTIRKEYVGYDVTCVDAEISFGFPPDNGVAAIGRFSPSDTETAFKNQSEWPSWAKTDYTTEEYNGFIIHSWGSGLEIHLSDRRSPPHIDVLGRAQPLAVTDRYLFYASAIEAVRSLIDASQDQHQSLADLPKFAAIANGLSYLKTYAAMIGDANLVSSWSILQLPDSQKRLEQLESQRVKLKNFLTFGSGVGIDEKGTYTAIVIYHENSDDALENVSLLKQHIEYDISILNKPWSEMITSTDIRAEGKVLLAKLYSSSRLWADWVFNYDNLLLHED